MRRGTIIESDSDDIKEEYIDSSKLDQENDLLCKLGVPMLKEIDHQSKTTTFIENSRLEDSKEITKLKKRIYKHLSKAESSDFSRDPDFCKEQIKDFEERLDSVAGYIKDKLFGSNVKLD